MENNGIGPTHFIVSAEKWEEFCLKLDSAEKHIAGLRRLMQESSVFETYVDPKTNLEYCFGPPIQMTWYYACKWVRRLGGKWHMPTIDELKPVSNFEHFDMDDYFIWSGDESEDGKEAGSLWVRDGDIGFTDKHSSACSYAVGVRKSDQFSDATKKI